MFATPEVSTLEAVTVGKIFTVIDTHTLFKIPNKLSTIMKNPVRTILGANQSTEIIPEAVELYIRLPLLVEFYKHIFYLLRLILHHNFKTDLICGQL